MAQHLRGATFLLVNLFLISSFFMMAQGKEAGTDLYCYQCHSSLDLNCEYLQPNDTTYYKTCPSSDKRWPDAKPFCRKIHQTVHTRGGFEVFIRSCGFISHSSQECYKVRNQDHAEVVCQCFSSGCNTAFTISPSSSTILLVPFFAAVSLKN